MARKPTDPEIGQLLLAHLREALGCPSLTYAEPPERIRGGARLIYRFGLSHGPAEFAGPLVLRIFWRSHDRHAPLREQAVHSALRELSYPAPRIVMANVDRRALGRPFTVMERLPGRPLMETLSPLGLVFRLPETVVRYQKELHALDAEAFLSSVERHGVPRRELSSVAAQLESLRRRMEGRRRSWLERGLRWLEEHQPRAPQRSVICHGDLAGNTLIENGAVSGVLDWKTARVADPALAVAHTRVGLLRRSELPALLRPFCPPLQRWVRARYFTLYRREAEADPQVLDYYEALARFERMLARPKRASEHLARFHEITGIALPAALRTKRST